jgi:hypothetical protein
MSSLRSLTIKQHNVPKFASLTTPLFSSNHASPPGRKVPIGKIPAYFPLGAGGAGEPSAFHLCSPNRERRSASAPPCENPFNVGGLEDESWG